MPKPPVAEERHETFEHLEHAWTDPWAWLRDRDDPDVIAHLEAENAYTQAQTAHLADLRTALYDEILGRIQEDDASVPWPRGPWRYYARTVEGEPYTLHCRTRGDDGDEEVYLDENERAEGHDYYSCGALTVSPDHRWLAWAEDTDGSEQYTIWIRDLRTGETLDHVIEGAKTTLVWANDSRHLYYSVPDETDRPWRLLRHDRTDPDAGDPVVVEEPDASFYLGAHRSRDDRFVLVGLHSKVTSEIVALDAADPKASPRVVLRRRAGVEYEVEPHGDWFYVLDNDDAREFRLIRVPVADPAAEPEVVIPHDPAVHLTGVDAFAGHLVVWERREGLPAIRVIDLATGDAHQVAFDEPTYVVRPEHNAEFDTATLRFTYESPRTPSSVFAYDLSRRERTLLKQDPVPHFDPDDYVTERLWATSHDGTRVPISLIRHRDAQPGGEHPAFLYGYGAYGLNSEPWFRRTWLSLVDRGVVCAIAHIRGGSEMGRHWYQSGKFLHKENSFLDFIACAERLVEQGWTRPDRLACAGGSAGGLLIGAVINARPDLFAAALAMVPFVDVVNTMLDESLPLTVTEYEEWGDLREPGFFEYIRGYAPYDNVADQPYPDLLVTAGLNDPRVGYWEPAKWVQRLRRHDTSGSPILLKTHLGAGHAGASGRYGRIEEAAFEYAFLLDRIGATDLLEG